MFNKKICLAIGLLIVGFGGYSLSSYVSYIKRFNDIEWKQAATTTKYLNKKYSQSHRIPSESEKYLFRKVDKSFERYTDLKNIIHNETSNYFKYMKNTFFSSKDNEYLKYLESAHNDSKNIVSEL